MNVARIRGRSASRVNRAPGHRALPLALSNEGQFDLVSRTAIGAIIGERCDLVRAGGRPTGSILQPGRSEEHTSELQSHSDLVCRLLLEKKKKKKKKKKNKTE